MDKDKFTHGKIKSYYRRDDGSVEIVNESFFDNPSAFERIISQSKKTSKNELLSDIISALSLINNKRTHELTITITTDEFKMPKLITKSYIETKESYSRR